MLFYAATIFLSAFLLFQVQPLVAKFIFPWFGGSAAVWSAALLFFQLLLLAGYLYARCIIRYLRPKQQFWIHGPLLIASLATLPIVPSAIWKPSGGGDPTLRILLLLGATIGLPCALLAATSPLLQAWYLRTRQGAIPYRLFALSNFGSMLALLSYPLVVEPRFALSRQALFWSGGYGVFVMVCVFVAWRSVNGTEHPEPFKDVPPPPRPADRALWIGFAAWASILLLAVSSHLTQNVAPIPLLWVAPLSLYLLSFILSFESDRIYNRAIFLPLLAVSLYLLTKGDSWYRNNADVSKLIPALCGALFVCCMVCHGELARRRPHPRYLTQFYLMVSIGGAVGGLFVALAAPCLFNSDIELPVGMVLCAALVTCALWNTHHPVSFSVLSKDTVKPEPPVLWDGRYWRQPPFRRLVRALPGRPAWMVATRAATAVLTIAFAAYLIRLQVRESREYLLSARNFYGVLRVQNNAASKYAPARGWTDDYSNIIQILQ